MRKILLFILLIAALKGKTECDSLEYVKDIKALLDFGKVNLNDASALDDDKYYKNFIYLLDKTESNIIKYQNCENKFYFYSLIFLYKGFTENLKTKATFHNQNGAMLCVDNKWKINPDSFKFIGNQIQKYSWEKKFDKVNVGYIRYNIDFIKDKDSLLSSKRYYTYFNTNYNFFPTIPPDLASSPTELGDVLVTHYLDKTKKILYFIIIISILFLITIILVLIMYKKNKKQNKLITEQKSVLEHQKQEITDSINYSKRIQTAILPDLNDIKQSLNDFFILYQPKDIVSGDFYYFNKVNSDVFIAAADCTGHGVPGAFMSLVGSKELKIANAMTNSPSQILKHLNNGVKDTLRQNHIDGTKDGMDIALVRINGTTVTYSAANRPLWILKKDSTTIEEIKATKTAIAGFTEDNFEFEEHEINLTKGDTIYLFSDGYADQFGGDKQKKMTTKRFREFILSIKDSPMTKQQNELENYFKSWQGNTEQVDDLLVIGIRL